MTRSFLSTNDSIPFYEIPGLFDSDSYKHTTQQTSVGAFAPKFAPVSVSGSDARSEHNSEDVQDKQHGSQCGSQRGHYGQGTTQVRTHETQGFSFYLGPCPDDLKGWFVGDGKQHRGFRETFSDGIGRGATKVAYIFTKYAENARQRRLEPAMHFPAVQRRG